MIRYLVDVEGGFKIHGAGAVLENIDALFGRLEKYRLYVTYRLAQDQLHEIVSEFRSSAKDAVLMDSQAESLSRTAWTIRETLYAESSGIVAFVISDKRHRVDCLLGNMGELFAPDVFRNMPDIAQSDFSEAGRCIAFGLPTAGAFHILRGTEDVLRTFYCFHVKRDRVRPLLWAPMVEGLKKRKAPPPEVLLSNLDNLRRSFRNPTQHPEKTYDIDEVQDLLGLAIDVVNRMVKIMV